MKITGIIAEFNPFHNGHAHLLKRARELTGAELVLVVMSGNFVQRGAPALLSKYARAEAALRCGADLVAELPVFCAAASAEFFAEGAVRLLADLGADSFVFGCEPAVCENFSSLALPLAELLLDEPPAYRTALRSGLASGLTFPAARRRAVSGLIPESAPLLDSPNSLLGLEYVRACRKRKLPLRPIAVERVGRGYHETSSALRGFFSEASGSLPHASGISPAENPGGLFQALSSDMPRAAFDILEREFLRTFPVTEDELSVLLSYQLLNQPQSALAGCADVGPELAARFFAKRFSCIRTADFLQSLKTKEVTYARLSRAILHIVLGISQASQDSFRAPEHSPYARLLGMTEAARPYLKNSAALPIPLIRQPARAHRVLSGAALEFFLQDIAAAELYRQLSYGRYRIEQPSEYERQFLVVPS
ncbi:MAG: nucleotidyltransferase family protein [Lachnospiraceae bacterium]|nr:nucleotidyltransferase family protein [Lachnospiraceae bacterium]